MWTFRCIPLTSDGNVVLISSRTGDWILPKGGWERDETAREAAARETYEEGGVHGLVHAEPFSETSYRNKRGEECHLLLFVMEVSELLPQWPESSVRRRRLCSLSEAIDICGKEEHRAALLGIKLQGLNTLFTGEESQEEDSRREGHHELHGAGSHHPNGSDSISDQPLFSTEASDGCDSAEFPGLILSTRRPGLERGKTDRDVELIGKVES